MVFVISPRMRCYGTLVCKTLLQMKKQHPTPQQLFAERAAQAVINDDTLFGLAVGGSWLTGMDEFSDIDLVVVTAQSIGGSKAAMLACAERFGKLLNGFTGEHVGEPRLLICLYEEPLLHVDLKFVTLQEFETRVEDPVILADKGDRLRRVLQTTKAAYPVPDYQWMEDRFWTWIHYGLLKIGRGEYFEAHDFLAFLRLTVLGPLLHIKNGRLPRGVRKVEADLNAEDLQALQNTTGYGGKEPLLQSLENAVALYRSLRKDLFKTIRLQARTEASVVDYLQEIKETLSLRPSKKAGNPLMKSESVGEEQPSLEHKALAFIRAVEERQSPEDIAEFYHHGIEQTEFPNAVTKHTTVRDLQALMKASVSGRKVIAKERYAVKNVYADENAVIAETEWTGTLAVPVGNLKPGDEMKAYFAQFFEFRDGKIYRQRNYDCFEPFG